MSLANDSASHNNPEDLDEGPAIPGGHGPHTLQAQHQFGGYPAQPGPGVPLHQDVLNPQPIENNQHMSSHWPNPYAIMPPGNVIVPGMAEPVNEKMVYHQHHVHHQQHLLPSQQQQQQQGTSRVHGWYDHNSSQMHQQQQPHGGPQMMGQQHHPHFIHDPHHQQPNSMAMMGSYDHVQSSMGKSHEYNMMPQQQPQQQQQPPQINQLLLPPQAAPEMSVDQPQPESKARKIAKVRTTAKARQTETAVQKQPDKGQTKTKKQTPTESDSKESWSICVDDEDESNSDVSDSDDLLESADEDLEEDESKIKSKTAKKGNKKKSAASSKKIRSKSNKDDKASDLSKLDDNAKEVAIKFKAGCECHDQNCFQGLDPENVSRHRLNIAELSKLEHDMYLMGVTVACLENSEENHRQKERKRLRAKYRFMGKDVCLSAFLYLDNTTLHQLKSIRKHVKSHGVTPRIHGNHRKKPHNTFSLDIYQYATRFLQAYFETHAAKDTGRKKGFIYLTSGMTCKKIHSEYNSYCQIHVPDSKTMGYSTFRHFLKEQFPNLRFQKDDITTDSSTHKNKPAKGQNVNKPLFLC